MRKYLTIHTPTEGRHYHASGAWKDETLLDVLAGHAAATPSAPALVDADRACTYGEALEAVRRVAALLAERDIADGDPVMVQLRNCATYPVVNLAVAAVGAVIVPVPVGLRGRELTAVTERVVPRALVTDAPRRGRAADVAAVAARGVELLDEADVAAAAFAPTEPGWDVASARGDADAVLDLMFTSGTTGLPKGILNTTNSKLSGLRPFVEAFGLGPGHTWLVVPPMAHNGGWLYSYLPALLSGAAAVFQDRFDPEETVRLLAAHDVAAVFFTPTHARDVLRVVDAGTPAPDALRWVFLGAADTPPELKRAIRERLGAAAVSLYGATENQAVTFVHPGTPDDVGDDSVGAACPGMEVAVFGPDRRAPLPVGEVGEVGTRGPGTFAGYFDDQAATFGSFNRDGWFFAGDLGVLDASGNLRLRGRSKELIIRGGRNIVPGDVEQGLERHPDVAAVCAVPLPDERLGERVCAVVVARRPGLRLDDLTSHLREHGYGAHLFPEALVVVDEFVYTDSGKVRRAAMRDVALAAAQEGRAEIAGDRGGPGVAEARA